MKKIIATAFSFLFAVSAYAIINGDGYYRVQNAKTQRYIYVLDDKGKLNLQATTAELGALQLWKDFNKTVSDPSTVIYVTDLNGKKQEYDLLTQGTGVMKIIDHPVSIRLANKSTGEYSVFGRNSGLTKYIGDGTRSSAQRGYLTSLDNGEYYRWLFHPIDVETNYFGITPEFDYAGHYYTTLYADFPFSFYSHGMTAYYVSGFDNNNVYIKEINGVVPRSTPVIIKTSNTEPYGNRLNIGGSASNLSDNILKGVFFCNHDDALHYNFVEYDKDTMRVLGRLSDGSIGFTTTNLKYLPRNKAYLVVPAGTPEELHLSTDDHSGIVDTEISTATVCIDGRELYVSGVEKVEVFNIAGSRVAGVNGAMEGVTVSLPSSGLYFVKAGNKVSKVFAQ